MQIRDESGDGRPVVAARHLALAAVIVAALAAIALLGPALDPSETTTPLPGEETATPTALPVPTPSPLPTPTSTPTPTPTPTAVPTEPGDRVAVDVVGGTELAIDEHGIWTRSGPNNSWTLNDSRVLPENERCRTSVGGKLAVVDAAEGDALRIAWFDPALPGWLDTTQPLPPIPQSPGLRSDDYCRGVVTSDGRLLLATANGQALILAIEQDDGSFQRRTITFPDEWARGDSPGSVGVRPLRHGDTIVAAHCSYYLDTGCLNTYFRLDPAAAQPDGPATMTWTEAGGEVILPSANADVTVYADLGGSIDQGFGLHQIGDEVWAVELIEEMGSTQGPDPALRVGRWAGGSLGTELVPIGSGNQPVLSAGENSVIASMIPLGEPTESGAPNPTAADADLWSSVEGWQRWSFDPGARRWQSLRADPTDARLPEQTYTVATLDWSRASSSTGDLGDAAQGEVRTWEEVVGTSSPMIVADRAFVQQSDTVWASDDRGETWTPHRRVPWSSGWPRCATNSTGGFAYLTGNTIDAATLTIETSAATDVIDWPLRRRFFVGDQGFRPCRPMWMDGRWWVGEVDHEHRTLRLLSTIDGQDFASHTVELSAQRQDALPGGTGSGTVDLYRGDGRIVVRLCRSGDGFPCFQSVDLELDAALLTEVSPLDGDPYFAADLATTVQGIDVAMRLRLHEVDGELWSVEDNSLGGTSFGLDGDAGVGRYGEPLERVAGIRADVRLRHGQVMRCAYDDSEAGESARRCEIEQPDGSWQQITDDIAVAWATVAPGTPVTFFDRTDDGVAMVVPS